MPFTFGEVFRLFAFEATMPTFQYAAHVPLSGTTGPQATMTYDDISSLRNF